MTRLAVLGSLLVCGTAVCQVDVLTGNYDNNRTSANLNESMLGPYSVGPGTFGLLASFPVSGQVYAQPLYISALDGTRCGTCDVVFVATMENNLYAFNATTLDSTPLWQANLGPPVPTELLAFRAIDPYVGILSTPVIDRGRNAIYLLAETLRAGRPMFQLHALDLSSGAEILNGPVTLSATVKGQGDDNVNGFVTFNPMRHIQRPGLLASAGRIYVAFGSLFDRGDYHGWVFAFDTGDLRNQVAVFNSTPDGGSGGIWQSGRGLVADAAGNVYLGTGNGFYDGMNSFGESFLRLTADLNVIDWFTPADWQYRSDVDLDTASLGPILIPSIEMIFAGDKDNNGYLIDRWNMGHLGVTGASVPQIFQPISFGGLFNTAVWDRASGPLVYFVEEGVATSGYRITDRQFEPQPFTQTPVTSDYPWQGMAVSAWSDLDGTGILWMTSGDHDMDDVPGTLWAFDAGDLTNLLWSSEMNPDRDRLGGFAKFATPTVANGLVIVPTFSNRVAVYGLLPDTSTFAPSRSNRTPLH